jgi:hypothetical protein
MLAGVDLQRGVVLRARARAVDRVEEYQGRAVVSQALVVRACINAVRRQQTAA